MQRSYCLNFVTGPIGHVTLGHTKCSERDGCSLVRALTLCGSIDYNYILVVRLLAIYLVYAPTRWAFPIRQRKEVTTAMSKFWEDSLTRHWRQSSARTVGMGDVIRICECN